MSSAKTQSERQRREAAALRENLKRRKAQARQRQAAGQVKDKVEREAQPAPHSKS
jgi:hypothetical protein